MEKYKNEIRDAENYTQHLKFDKQHPWYRNLIALYLSLIEYSDSLIYLVENEKRIAVPVVFRSLLEAYADFKNLSADKMYGYHMEASNAREWLKLLEEASKNKNSYLKLTALQPDLASEIQQQKTKISEFKAKGYEALSIENKFNKAGIYQEYKSIYNYLCAHSHNNINSLCELFFVVSKSDYEVILFKKSEDGEFDSYLTTGCEILRNGNHIIHAILKTGYETNFPVE